MISGLNPLNNMQGFMSQFQGFVQNPAQYIMHNKINIPQQFQNNPDEMIKYMMNNGMISQQQYNMANEMSKKITDNPMFRMMIRNTK